MEETKLSSETSANIYRRHILADSAVPEPPFQQSPSLFHFARNSLPFMKLKDPIPCSQQSATDPYPEPD
jgi:hypothetical protein